MPHANATVVHVDRYLSRWVGRRGKADCLNIENNLERLVCYDERAGAYRRQRERDAAQVEVSPQVLRTVEAPIVQVEVPTTGSDQAMIAQAEGLSNFGRRKAAVAPGKIATRIDSVRKVSRRRHVMSLANGQVSSENEPGARPIDAGQDVTIARKRFHFEMRLASGRKVAVRRIDVDHR